MNWTGLLIGLLAFVIIGVFHPLVIKMEYYLGRKSWWMFFMLAIGFSIASIVAKSILSIVLGTLGFACFWSTFEIFKQHERVMKGRAKKNPKRNYREYA
jgi:uncharacterized membrane protein